MTVQHASMSPFSFTFLNIITSARLQEGYRVGYEPLLACIGNSKITLRHAIRRVRRAGHANVSQYSFTSTLDWTQQSYQDVGYNRRQHECYNNMSLCSVTTWLILRNMAIQEKNKVKFVISLQRNVLDFELDSKKQLLPFVFILKNIYDM